MRTGSDVRRDRLILIGLLILLIASAARSYSRLPELPANPADGVDANTLVPAPVMSTLRGACFDCHSNETRWPWYSRLPVAGHLIARDVREGRAQLDWSLWESYNRFARAELLDKACERMSQGMMPPWQYRLLHPGARPSEPDVDEFCEWSRRESARLAEGGS